jgi:putative FmdB family regulatory protein
MPIYVFRCEDCGEKFDRLQKLSAPDPDTCPTCGRHHVRRQVTAPAFRLAGSGWYETDFKSDREKKHNLAGYEPAAKPSSDGAPSTEKHADKPAAGEKTGRQANPAEPKTSGNSAVSSED